MSKLLATRLRSCFDVIHPGGSITLNATDTLGMPLIDPNILTTDMDVFQLKEAIKMSFKYLSSPTWTSYIGDPVDSLADLVNSEFDDNAFNDFLRGTAFSAFHMVGSCAMSAEGHSWGVVNPDLRVKGLKGLRIVDASVLVSRFCIYPAFKLNVNRYSESRSCPLHIHKLQFTL